MLELTDKTFDSALTGELPVMVDFWASWCQPCARMMPVVEEMERRYADRLVFAKVDVDPYMTICTRYGVQAVPTFLFFKDGQVAGRLSGSTTPEQLAAEIERVLA